MNERDRRRFYYSHSIEYHQDRLIVLPDDESHHLLHVIRCRPGGRVELFDALGQGFVAELVGDVDGKAEVQLKAELPVQRLEGPCLRMAVAVLKRRAMDWMIEKLSELGAETLMPLLSRRCVGRNDIPVGEPPPERWDRLAIAAAKQCGRNQPMRILPPVRLDQWFGSEDEDIFKAFAHPSDGALPLVKWLMKCPADVVGVELVIGPEGGWTDEEAAALEEAGCQPVSLGGLTLRAETAAMAAAATCRLVLDSRSCPDS
jgi:16S rRNA (uracil1498-N3)-methyltransferase